MKSMAAPKMQMPIGTFIKLSNVDDSMIVTLLFVLMIGVHKLKMPRQHFPSQYDLNPSLTHRLIDSSQPIVKQTPFAIPA
ncbi:hypothetical protein ACSTK8_22550 [Vibrio parahaemolyticus]